MTSFGSQKVQLSERGGVWPCETSLVQVFLACQTPWGGGGVTPQTQKPEYIYTSVLP